MIGGYSESLLYYIFISCKLVISHFNCIKVLQKTISLESKLLYVYFQIFKHCAPYVFLEKKTPLPFHKFLNLDLITFTKCP